MQAEATTVSTDGSGNDAIMVVEGAAMDVQEDFDVGGPFPQRKPLPQAIRQQIVDLAQQGVRVNQIAKQLNTTRGSVGKILARYYNTGSIQPRPPRPGFKVKVATPEVVEKIASYKRENPKILAWEIRNKLVADGMFSTRTAPCIRTVQRILKNKIVDGQVLPGGSLSTQASPKTATSDEGDSTLLSPTTVDQRKLSHLAPDLSQQQAPLQAGEIVTYESGEDLQNHMAAEMQMRKNVSKDCDKSKERFRIHPCGRIDANNTTHKRTTRDKKSKSKTAEYICLHCTKTFHTRLGLRKHLIKDHSQKRPSTADKEKTVQTTHNPMKQINKDDSRKFSSKAVKEKAEQKKQVMTNEELVKLKIPVKELLNLKRAGEEKEMVKEETFERDIASDVLFYGNDVADISFDGNDISDVSSDENDFLDVLFDENYVSDVFSDENDVSDHIPSDENDVSDHIPSNENDVSDFSSDKNDFSNVSSDVNNFPDVLSDGNDVTDVASYGEVVSDVPSDGNDVSDVPSYGNDVSDVTSYGNDVSVVASNGKVVSDVTSYGKVVSDVSSDGNDTSVVASDGNIFSDVFPDTDFVSTVPSEAPVEAVVQGEESAEESTTSEVPSQEETIDITEIMENENLYRCKECVKTFATRERFYDHEKSHKILKCEVCQQVMKRYSMKQHMRIHTGYRPYVCEHCPNSRYIKLGHLARHMREKHNADANWSRDYVVKAEDVRKTQKEMVQQQNRNKNETISTNVAAADVGIDDADLDDRLHERFVQNVDNSDIMQMQVHKCKFCEKVFNDVNHLNNHVNIHIQTRDYQCRFCGEKFVFPERLTRHIVYHTGSFECSICQTLHPTYTKLQQHEKVEHPLHCKMCSRKCETTAALMEHLQFHKNIDLQCMQCMKVFYHRTTLWKHEKEEHGDPGKVAHQDMVKEEVKNKDEKSDDTSEVVIHPDVQIQDIPAGLQLQVSQQQDIGQQQHEVQLQESPDHVEQIQDIPEGLQLQVSQQQDIVQQQHEVQLEGGQEEDEEKGEKKQRRKRRLALSNYDRTIKLRKQHNTAHLIREFRCEHCPGQYTSKQNLFKHIRAAHLDQAPPKRSGRSWSCDYCGKAMRSKTYKREHERIHTGERPYSCRLCTTSFSWISARNEHERSVHMKENKETCQVCNKSFDRREMRHHMAVHTGEKPFRCPYCQKSFSQKKIMNKHIRCAHPGSEIPAHIPRKRKEPVINEVEGSQLPKEKSHEMKIQDFLEGFHLSVEKKSHEMEVQEILKGFQLPNEKDHKIQTQDIPEGFQLPNEKDLDIPEGFQLSKKKSCEIQIQDIPEGFQLPNEKDLDIPEGFQLPEKKSCEIQIQDIPEGFQLPNEKDLDIPEGFQLPEKKSREIQIQDIPEGFQMPNKKDLEIQIQDVPEGFQLPMENGEIQVQVSPHWSCEFCHKQLKTKELKEDHERIHTGERPFSCRLGCTQSFTNEYIRNKHERCVHMKECRIPCKVCNQIYDSCLQAKHDRECTGKPHVPPKPKKWSCDLCDKRFDSKVLKEVHERIHTGERPFSCRLGCSQVFISELNRNNHERCVHMKECRIPCKACNQIYDSCRQTRHDRVCPGNGQTAPKPGVKYYSCDFCNKPMIDSSHKRIHEMSHRPTGERPFCCRLGCKLRFTKKRDLERHERHVHLKTCRLVCEVCNKTYCSCRKWEHAKECKQQNNHGV